MSAGSSSCLGILCSEASDNGGTNLESLFVHHGGGRAKCKVVACLRHPVRVTHAFTVTDEHAGELVTRDSIVSVCPRSYFSWTASNQLFVEKGTEQSQFAAVSSSSSVLVDTKDYHR